MHIALELLLWSGSCRQSGLVACLCLVRPLEPEPGAVWVCKEEKMDRLGSKGRCSNWNLLLDLQRLDAIAVPYHTKQLFQEVPCWGALLVILCYWFEWNKALVSKLCVSKTY